MLIKNVFHRFFIPFNVQSGLKIRITLDEKHNLYNLLTHFIDFFCSFVDNKNVLIQN
ncbi:hypothetical protein SAMN05421766_102507 [Zobellia uliginosa]|uniref:Uncharacterized protein n=1 Tax=Zobellia uliginosa TaxID=143224 RepID=A0ABY1KN08_9FLAO|nr:hypothetical protein SAMN05421766_102507 [Zobellia uliginosa]